MPNSQPFLVTSMDAFCFRLTYCGDFEQGISTYDYILAVREEAERHGEQAGDRVNSLTSSPASSNATGVSAGFSSAEAPSLYRGVFCTPPRMFVEHHQVQNYLHLVDIHIYSSMTTSKAIHMSCSTNHVDFCIN